MGMVIAVVAGLIIGFIFGLLLLGVGYLVPLPEKPGEAENSQEGSQSNH